MLLPISNVLSPDGARALCRSVSDAPWVGGGVSAGDQARAVKRNEQLDTRSAEAEKLANDVVSLVSRHPLFLSAALPKRIFPPLFNRYAGGGSYGAHVDSAIMYPPGSTDSLRTDLSATLFLSEADSYDGGELLIHTDSGQQEIKLDAGDLILYPSISLHEVRPVTRGERICAVFWVQSLVAESSQRKLLFDLDQSIQVLTSERGHEDHEVVRLTGIYHNLVRTWAQA